MFGPRETGWAACRRVDRGHREAELGSPLVELVLVIGLPAALLAACWWAFRAVRGKQQRGELTNLPLKKEGGVWVSGYDSTEGAPPESHSDQGSRPDNSPSERADD